MTSDNIRLLVVAWLCDQMLCKENLLNVYFKNFLRTSVDVLKCKLELVAVSPKHNALIYSTAGTEDISVD